MVSSFHHPRREKAAVVMEEAPEPNRITAGTVLIELDVIRRVGGNKLTFHHHLSSLLLHFLFFFFFEISVVF